MNLVYFSLTYAQLCLPPGMSASQDNFLNQEEYEVWGKVLRDQLAQHGEDSSEWNGMDIYSLYNQSLQIIKAYNVYII